MSGQPYIGFADQILSRKECQLRIASSGAQDYGAGSIEKHSGISGLEPGAFIVKIAGEDAPGEDEDRHLADALGNEAEYPGSEVNLMALALLSWLKTRLDGPWLRE